MGALKITSTKKIWIKKLASCRNGKSYYSEKQKSSVETQFLLPFRSRGYMLCVNKSTTWPSYKTNSILSMTQQPFSGPWNPSEDASILLYLLSVYLNLLIPRTCEVSLLKTSFHLTLGFPTGPLKWNFTSQTFFGIYSSSILIARPTYPSLLISISSTIFRSLYKL